MSRLLYFRFRPHDSRQPLCLELARTRSHVSVKRHQRYRHGFPAHRALSRTPGSGREEYVNGNEVSQPSQGRMNATPAARILVFPSEEAATATSREPERHSVAQPNEPITSRKLSWSITNASNIQRLGKGLGSWVTIPDGLVSRTENLDTKASGGGGEDRGTSPRSSVLEQLGIHHKYLQEKAPF